MRFFRYNIIQGIIVIKIIGSNKYFDYIIEIIIKVN